MQGRRGHKSAQYWDMLKKAKQKGFSVEMANGKVFIYPPDNSLPFYTSHPGETAIHPIRRFINKTLAKIKQKEENDVKKTN